MYTHRRAANKYGLITRYLLFFSSLALYLSLGISFVDGISDEPCVKDGTGACISNKASNFRMDDILIASDEPKERNSNKSSCKDKHRDCSVLAESGECEINPTQMFERCSKSCNFCLDFEHDVGVEQNMGGKPSEEIATARTVRKYNKYVRDVVITLSKSEIEKCKNHHELCAFWAGANQCTEESEYMKQHCPLACQQCQSVIYDKRGIVQELGGNKEERQRTQVVLEESESYLEDLVKTLPTTQRDALTKKCKNINSLCSFWAAHGTCDNSEYDDYMVFNCPLACRRCDELDLD